MVLYHHPDKKGNVTDEEAKEADTYFSLIQKAYDVMTNEKLRLLYDSVDVDVDDRVPAVTQDENRFYKDFPPLFAKNARWFEKQPAPLLGDRDTPYEEVAAVYEFWYNTKSWREFGFHLDPDEDDPEQAQSRDEKRWREQQLKNSRKKKKTAENARLLKLIDNAYASDPRIRKFKEDAKKAKEDAKRKKEEERLEKERREAEEARRAEEERIASENAAKAESKSLTENAKKARRAFQKALKRREVFDANAAAADNLPIPDEAKVENLRVNLPYERLNEICDLPDRASFVKAVLLEIDIMEGRAPAHGSGANGADGAAGAEEPEARDWTADEQKLLEAALRNVPKEAADRWDQVAALVPGRTKKECVERVKECAKKVQNSKVTAPEQWTAEEERVLTKAASKVFPPGTQGDRYGLISEYVKTHAHTAWTRDVKQVIAKVAAMKNISSTLSSVRDGANHFEDFKKNVKSLDK